MGVAFFRLFCLLNERSQLPKDTSTSPAQLLPSNRPQLRDTLVCRTKLTFLMSRVIFQVPLGSLRFRGVQSYWAITHFNLKKKKKSDTGLILHAPTKQREICSLLSQRQGRLWGNHWGGGQWIPAGTGSPTPSSVVNSPCPAVKHLDWCCRGFSACPI